MRDSHRIPYEKAETAKSRLLELLNAVEDSAAPQREIDQLVTIIGKLEAWQNKYTN